MNRNLREERRLKKCLNPYYTGIHLHGVAAGAKLTYFRLNPYYTGIHLHSKNSVFLRGRQLS